MLTYAILNHLPKLPDELIHDAALIKKSDALWRSGSLTQPDDRIIINKRIADIYGDRVLKIRESTIQSTVPSRYYINEFDQYVKKFIAPSAIATTLSISAGSSHNGPHIDSSREYALLYVVDPGGENVSTAFYQESGKPIVRPKIKPLVSLYKEYVNDYSLLTEIDRVVLPTHTWVILNANILHSVENLSGPRVTYQIALNDNPFNKE
jgi:hypothetical protein